MRYLPYFGPALLIAALAAWYLVRLFRRGDAETLGGGIAYYGRRDTSDTKSYHRYGRGKP